MKWTDAGPAPGFEAWYAAAAARREDPNERQVLLIATWLLYDLSERKSAAWHEATIEALAAFSRRKQRDVRAGVIRDTVAMARSLGHPMSLDGALAVAADVDGEITPEGALKIVYASARKRAALPRRKKSR